MSFLSPAFLFGFALLAPLVAVFLLKVRPRRRPTTALFLWEQVFTQKKANALLQRLRDVLSLLLLALAVAALVLAASGLRFDGGDDRDVLVLIDTSASMSADLDADRPGRSRFEEATDRAAALVRSLGGTRRAAIATVDQELRFATGLTDEPRRLRDGLAGVAAGELPSDGEALGRIAEVAGLGDALQVVLFTDGVGLDETTIARLLSSPTTENSGPEPQDASSDARPAVDVVYVGPADAAARPGNLGFAAADLLAGREGTGGRLMFTLISSFAEAVNAEVRLVALPEGTVEALGDARPIKVVPLRLEPGESATRVLGVETGAGRYALTVAPLNAEAEPVADALALDDTAFLSVPEPRPLRVAVDATDRYFFETAVRAFERTGGLLALAEPGAAADVSITRDGAKPGETPLRIVFASGSETGDDALTEVLPRVLQPDHPVLRFLSPESMRFSGARRVEPAVGSAVLVADVSGVPLIWQHRDVDTGVVRVAVNLDPAAGDFVLSPDFPVLVYAAATDLGGRDTAQRATYATGTTAPVPGLRPGETAKVTGPDATPRSVSDTRPRVALRQAGFHVAATPTADWDLPASVLHAAESSLQTPDGLLGSSPDALPGGGYPPWVWLTLLGLAIVVGEEALYHRRKVG